jgi:hypothetical protein
MESGGRDEKRGLEMSRREGRIIEIREAALRLLKARGTWEPIGQSKCLEACCGSLSMALRTPFQRLPEPGEYILNTLPP